MLEVFLKIDLEQVVSGKNGTGKYSKGTNGKNGKLGENGTFSTLALKI